MKSISLITASCLLTVSPLMAWEEASFEKSNNSLGLDIFKQLDYSKQNTCISPLSIQSAMMMTHNGASGDTLSEMRKVLHLNAAEQNQYNKAYKQYIDSFTKRIAKKPPEYLEIEPIKFRIANRLFGDKSYPFRASFTKDCSDYYSAPTDLLDIKNNPENARKHINNWVEKQTEKKIKNLLPPRSVSRDTKLVLVNALYLKAPWKNSFHKRFTKDLPFHLSSGKKVNVPTMYNGGKFGYKNFKTYHAIALPYGAHGDLEFLIILPKKESSLNAVVKSLDAKKLKEMRGMPQHLAKIKLPKFKTESDPISLKKTFNTLGMVKAFDLKQADFSKMERPNAPIEEQLFISDIFHKTFIEIDEKGTEAAAASAVLMAEGSAHKPEEIVDFTIDRPFIYAIQDAKTGTCFFLGTITDPSK